MTSTYTIVSQNPGLLEVITRATDAEALRAVYETLVDWSDDERTKANVAAAIAEGVVYPAESQQPIFLEFEPAAFWSRAAALLTTDAMDFFPGETAPGEA